MNTKIWFTYRDGANYKFQNEYVLEGTFADEDKIFLKDFKDAEVLLIPNQIDDRFLNCCPSPLNKDNTTHSYKYDEEIDHPYHGLVFEERGEPEDAGMTCSEFMQLLKNTNFNEFDV